LLALKAPIQEYKLKKNKMLSHLACAAALMLAGAASAGVIGSNTTPVVLLDGSNAAPGTVQSTINITTHGNINALTVSIAANHSWIGDLTYVLTHGSTTVTLMSKPGTASATGGGSAANVFDARPISFSDLAGLPAAETIGAGCGNGEWVGIGPACSNTAYLSHQALSAFAGMDMFGDWTLYITDNGTGDTGSLARWSLSNADATGEVPEPGMLALLGLAMSGMFAARRRKL
jgi:subtilisin-like proprotein convertase family protein